MQLNSPLESSFRIQDGQKIALKKLGIKTIEDLLYHFPVRYGDTSEKRNIGSLVAGDNATIFGKISKAFQTWHSGLTISHPVNFCQGKFIDFLKVLRR